MPKEKSNSVDAHVGSRLRMRRLMLDMSRAEIASALGLSLRQFVNYERGTIRVNASRLQLLSQLLKVPASFFFEGAPAASADLPGGTPEADETAAYVKEFLATSDGLALSEAFTRIPSAKLRRSIVLFVEQIAAEAELSMAAAPIAET